MSSAREKQLRREARLRKRAAKPVYMWTSGQVYMTWIVLSIVCTFIGAATVGVITAVVGCG